MCNIYNMEQISENKEPVSENKELVKGKGIRRLFRDNGYKLYLVDEFRTSCICSICKEET